jgi:hypothetical protein
VRRIVDGFDGRITIENIAAPERCGLRVVVTLPAAAASLQSERTDARP